MREHGFIKLHRSILDWRWYKDVNTCHLFTHLQLMANYTSGDFRTHTLKRGQLITSLKHLSEQTGLTVQQVRTALNHLKSTNDITINSTSKYTMITINNYEMETCLTHSSTNNQKQYKSKYNNKHRKNNKGMNNHSLKGEELDDYIAIFESKSLFKD